MTAEEILAILKETCGEPMDKEDFFRHVKTALETGEKLEYRFQGHLGFGGKIWLNKGKTPYVTCYQEDETVGRKVLVKMANEELTRLAGVVEA